MDLTSPLPDLLRLLLAQRRKGGQQLQCCIADGGCRGVRHTPATMWNRALPSLPADWRVCGGGAIRTWRRAQAGRQLAHHLQQLPAAQPRCQLGKQRRALAKHQLVTLQQQGSGGSLGACESHRTREECGFRLPSSNHEPAAAHPHPAHLGKALQQGVPATIVWQRQLDVALDESAQRPLITLHTRLRARPAPAAAHANSACFAAGNPPKRQNW